MGLAWLAFAVAPASAEILLTADALALTGTRPRMPTLLIAQTPTSQAAYLMQRSRSWSGYRRSEARTGLPLVAVPAVGGQVTASSARQASVREHLARAQAYRLGDFGK